MTVETDSGGNRRFFVDTNRLIRPWLRLAIACLILVILMDGLAVYIAETYECSEPLGDPEKSLAVAVLGTLYFGGFFLFAALRSGTSEAISQFDEVYSSESNVVIFMRWHIFITIVDCVIIAFFVATLTSPIIAAMILRTVAVSCHAVGRIF